MITEDYVSVEIAKLLRNKGFDWEVHRSYLVNDNVFIPGDINDVPQRKDAIRIPTLQMAMKWLREKHIVIVSDVENFYADGSVSSWVYHIWCDDNFEENNSVYFKTYEEACEAAIKYCLENLI